MNVNATLIGQLASFAVFLFVIIKYVVPPLIRAVEERQNTISRGLMNAEQAAQELASAEETAKQIETQARTKSHDMLLSAEKQANVLIEQAKTDAKKAGEKELVLAREDIAQEVSQSKEALRKQMAALVMAAAEQVVGREVDANKHAELVRGAAEKL